MPQLDSTTFVYQYFGVITLLLFVYVVLSYISLPLILRLMLVRNLFLSTRQTFTALLKNSSNAHRYLINFRAPLKGQHLATNLLGNIAAVTNHWINLVVSTLSTLLVLNDVSTSKDINLFMGAFTVDYLILFLSIELGVEEEVKDKENNE